MGVRAVVPYHEIMCPTVFVATANPAGVAYDFEKATKYLDRTTAKAGREGKVSNTAVLYQRGRFGSTCRTTLTLRRNHQGFQ
jgi:hypothetical protein